MCSVYVSIIRFPPDNNLLILYKKLFIAYDVSLFC